ncbi:hypothetical protein [Muriicola sp. Z0-33]|uniref:hypothetical protein n=1 Tax=Muriicola sp. Z0-33 TaxID=2816957 RepID=UPI00223803F6|nr:hypothetical protein [Muriicola sp. Z0-33]MCW5516173.1 hypothetical protein [Muriicola sp. Z0-33]
MSAQFTKTITLKNGGTEIITKTTDQRLRTVYTCEYADKYGRLIGKRIFRKDLLNNWEHDEIIKSSKNKTEFIMFEKFHINEKGEITSWKKYDRNGKLYLTYNRNSKGVLVGKNVNPNIPVDDEHNYYGPGEINDKIDTAFRRAMHKWFENLRKDIDPPAFPDRNDIRKKEQAKKEKAAKTGKNGESNSSKGMKMAQGWVEGTLHNSNNSGDSNCDYKDKYLIFMNQGGEFINLSNGKTSESVIVAPGEKLNVATSSDGAFIRVFTANSTTNAKARGQGISFSKIDVLYDGWWYTAGCWDGNGDATRCDNGKGQKPGGGNCKTLGQGY